MNAQTEAMLNRLGVDDGKNLLSCGGLKPQRSWQRFTRTTLNHLRMIRFDHIRGAWEDNDPSLRINQMEAEEELFCIG
jgi:hypothetical protein